MTVRSPRSGRQKLGRRGCDGERLPKDKLEAAILGQLTGLYRDGSIIRNAIEQAAAIVDLQINSRAEVLPTYRVGAPVVCRR